MRLACAGLALVLIGCSQSPVEAGTTQEPGYVTLAHFTGELDSATGTLAIRMLPTAAGQALEVASLTIPGATPGVTVANAGPVFNNEPGHCMVAGQSSGAPVGVKSNYPAGTWLDNTYAVIDTLSPSGTEGCNSTTAVGLDSSNGLWSYGSLASGDNPATVWAFKFLSATHSTFSGRIVASKATRLTTAFPAMVGTAQADMAGSTARAIFLLANRTVAIVDSSGSVTYSPALTSVGTGVATNSDGSQIWVALGSAKKIARLNGDGSAPIYHAITAGDPNAIAVDPATGVVWYSLVGDNKVGWFDPGSGLQGTVGVTEKLLGSLVITYQGATCALFGSLSATSLAHVNCTAKTKAADIPLGTSCRHTDAQGMAARGNGELWLAATSSVSGLGTICSVSSANVLSLAFTAPSGTYAGLAFGSDGNLWTMNSVSGLVRIWLGATGYGTVTTMPSVVDITTGGLVSGAGQVWAPYGASGSTNVWMVSP